MQLLHMLFTLDVNVSTTTYAKSYRANTKIFSFQYPHMRTQVSSAPIPWLEKSVRMIH